MSLLSEFIRPETSECADLPEYYRHALAMSEAVMAAYWLLLAGLQWIAGRAGSVVPVLLALGVGACRATLNPFGSRWDFYGFSALVVGWCAWCVRALGWDFGGQHFLVLLLMLCLFNAREPMWLKLTYFAGLLSYRMLLFVYALDHIPLYPMSATMGIWFQSVNNVVLFVLLSIVCIMLSSSLQSAERQLRIDNQELHREADTDPLTQLPNRRAMLDTIEAYKTGKPNGFFSVAIADIDFFKRVNDTYGHNCGDYTLKQLADLFQQHAGVSYSVCRWGGEEFCFFLPDHNLDTAGQIMFDLCHKVRHMPLSFDGHDFSITITIGVAENDFTSTMHELMEQADKKLYLGKIHGRDQVVL